MPSYYQLQREIACERDLLGDWIVRHAQGEHDLGVHIRLFEAAIRLKEKKVSDLRKGNGRVDHVE